MFNEENRDKAVFEDFGFKATDMDELERRKIETIKAINEGKLPVEEIKGEVQIKLLNFDNLTRVEGKDVVHWKLKREYFTDAPNAAVKFRKDKPGFMTRSFDWET